MSLPISRFLCLHGYGQNAKMFSSKTGAIRKALKGIEFVYAESPIHLDHQEDGRTWWRRSNQAEYEGLNESLEYLFELMDKRGPFEGILGFSQGATMATLLSHLLLKPQDLIKITSTISTTPPPFSQAILFSGHDPTSPLVNSLINSWPEGMCCRSLHVIGEKDELIPPERSLMLSQCFREPQYYYHPGGHLVPGDVKIRNYLKDFIIGFY